MDQRKVTSFEKNDISYTICLIEDTLTIETKDNTNSNKWSKRILNHYPIATGKDMSVESLFGVFEDGAKGIDADLDIQFPVMPNKEDASFVIKIEIKHKRLPSDTFQIDLDPKSQSENEKLRDMILDRDNTIQDLIRRVTLLEMARSNQKGFQGIQDSAFSASSIYNINHHVTQCRLNSISPPGYSHAWCAGSNDTNQWIQVDLGSVKNVFGILTQGRGDCEQWVTAYTLQWSVDGTSFTKIGDFGGNVDKNTVNLQTINPIKARFIRLLPRGWNQHVSLRWDVSYN